MSWRSDVTRHLLTEERWRGRGVDVQCSPENGTSADGPAPRVLSTRARAMQGPGDDCQARADPVPRAKQAVCGPAHRRERSSLALESVGGELERPAVFRNDA